MFISIIFLVQHLILNKEYIILIKKVSQQVYFYNVKPHQPLENSPSFFFLLKLPFVLKLVPCGLSIFPLRDLN